MEISLCHFLNDRDLASHPRMKFPSSQMPSRGIGWKSGQGGSKKMNISIDDRIWIDGKWFCHWNQSPIISGHFISSTGIEKGFCACFANADGNFAYLSSQPSLSISMCRPQISPGPPSHQPNQANYAIDDTEIPFGCSYRIVWEAISVVVATKGLFQFGYLEKANKATCYETCVYLYDPTFTAQPPN